MKLTITDTPIRQDKEGRYCLNDLHKAAGALSKDQPSKWLILESTTALILEIDSANGNLVSEKNQAVMKVQGGDGWQGTFVRKELVYAYAMWISAAFHIKVIRSYDAMMTTPRTDVAKRVKSAINARAWALAHSNYDVYRSMMLTQISLEDPASMETVHHWNPPDMLPATAIDEAINALSALKEGRTP